MSQPKTILITGVSSGFGQALAAEALAAGHRVIGTVRREEAAKAFEAHESGRAHARLLDLTDTPAISLIVGEISSELSPVDVLVNNAPDMAMKAFWKSLQPRRCDGSSRSMYLAQSR